MSKFDTKRNGRVVRAPKDRENPYVMMNKEFLSVDTLSWKAKGILAYLLSKMDNWFIIIEDIMKQSTDRETAVRSGLKELQDHNYIQRYPAYWEGKVYCWESMVSERPFPDSEKIQSAIILSFDEDGYPKELEYTYISDGKKKGKKSPKKTVKKSEKKSEKKGGKKQKEKSLSIEPQGIDLLPENLKVGNLKVDNLDVENQGLLIKEGSKERELVKNEFSNKSINLSKEEEEEENDRRMDTELNELFIRMQIDSLPEHKNFNQSLKRVITHMYKTTQPIKVTGTHYLPHQLKDVVRQLTYEHLINTLKRFDKFSMKTKMDNPTGYIRSVLVNIVTDLDIQTKAEVNYEVTGHGRMMMTEDSFKEPSKKGAVKDFQYGLPSEEIEFIDWEDE